MCQLQAGMRNSPLRYMLAVGAEALASHGRHPFASKSKKMPHLTLAADTPPLVDDKYREE
jgi:hypothetical protein